MAITEVAIITGVPGSTKLVNPAITIAHAFGFKGCKISPYKKFGGFLRDEFTTNFECNIR